MILVALFLLGADCCCGWGAGCRSAAGPGFRCVFFSVLKLPFLVGGYPGTRADG